MPATKYGRHLNDGEYDMFYGKQSTCKENEFLLGNFYIDPQTINYETLAWYYELNDTNNAFKGKVELNADEKTMDITLTTQHDLNFTELIDVFGLYKKEKSCWNTLSENLEKQPELIRYV